jgi:hypothetical protein
MEFSDTQIEKEDPDRIFVHRMADIVESLCNLTYLICEDADYPEKVRQYAGISEERLRTLIELLRSRNSQGLS